MLFALIPRSCSMKRLGAFLLSPRWDPGPSQGLALLPASPVPSCADTWVERGTVRVKCHRTPRPLYPESSALSMRPPRLPWWPQATDKTRSSTHNSSYLRDVTNWFKVLTGIGFKKSNTHSTTNISFFLFSLCLFFFLRTSYLVNLKSPHPR